MRMLVLVCCMCCLFFLCLPGTVAAASVEDPTVSDSAVPAADSSVFAVDLDIVDSGKYASWSVSSQLGSIHLTLPHGTDASALAFVGDRLVNMSSSTIYLYCSEFPDYIFSASRFGPVTYRESNASGYQTVELVVSAAEVVKHNFGNVFWFCGLLVVLLIPVWFFHRW